ECRNPSRLATPREPAFVLIPVGRPRRPSATVSPVPSQRSTRRGQRANTAEVTRHRTRYLSRPRSRYLSLSQRGRLPDISPAPSDGVRLRLQRINARESLLSLN